MFLMGLLTTMEEPVAYDKMSDEKLLLRVAEGDKAAFQQLYQNTDKTIYGFILSILRNPQDSEEVMQELYLKVWTSAGSYQSQGKPLAWMFTIARNLCYMRFRDQKHEADIGLSDLSEMETGEFCPQIAIVSFLSGGNVYEKQQYAQRSGQCDLSGNVLSVRGICTHECDGPESPESFPVSASILV